MSLKEDVIQEIKNGDFCVFRDLSSQWKNDEDVALVAIAQYQHNCDFIGSSLKNVDFYVKAVKIHPGILSSSNDIEIGKYCDNEDFMRRIVSEGVTCAHKASKRLLGDRDFVLFCVKTIKRNELVMDSVVNLPKDFSYDQELAKAIYLRSPDSYYECVHFDFLNKKSFDINQKSNALSSEFYVQSVKNTEADYYDLLSKEYSIDTLLRRLPFFVKSVDYALSKVNVADLRVLASKYKNTKDTIFYPRIQTELAKRKIYAISATNPATKSKLLRKTLK